MGPSADLAIETSDLTKTFGTTRAVDGVDLSVETGTVFGFLGPNGAGKTTTIRILSTLTRPDSGTAQVFGLDVVRQAEAVRARIGLTGQYASIDEDLTGRENLILLGRLLGHPWPRARSRADELLAAFDLTEAAGRSVKTYSGGMRRRLDIAASVIVTPDLLFLDEPTTGLDPASRNQVWDVVRDLVEAGTTVLLTTQYLHEADVLANRMAVIDQGRVIAQGTPAELKSSVGSATFQVRLHDAEQRAEAERLIGSVLAAAAHPGGDPATLTVSVAEPDRASQALAELAAAGIAVDDFSLGRPSMDEVFLALTGHRAEADRTTNEEVA
ncbi:ATP-binding cassette domain-containing protein [Micromonospora sp. WMMD1128]|uniref:ATP-binding cassette domain-containing protein n=1 Tax=unclassified Micromonospora TaxID=2617518 RepID=UPI00248B06FB|nr:MULTISPECIES: ATP-binding cassette domain-containing protein [unclassified Micromonospora]WBB75792.1 ATP-binding cassette domain-containing protein [Micromonospora sp. WMMD1128]WFE36418.1 ATP-binding cassette domain-containing protein [Micromonospora sp. WMMD975]